MQPVLLLLATSYTTSLQPFLRKNCEACHNATTQSGGLNLQVQPNGEKLEKILSRIETGSMPPPPLPRPKAAELKLVSSWIRAEIARQDKLLKPEAGHVTARRLNRSEYNNTVRDLLALDLDLAGEFPQDDSAYGFDNVSEALTISPLLMEKYMAAAEKIARLAVYGPEIRKVSTTRYTPTLPRRMENNPVKLEEPPFYTFTDYDETGLSHPGAFRRKHRFPATGSYVLRFIPNGTRPPGSEPQFLDIYLDGVLIKTMPVIEKKTVTNEVEPVAHEVEVRVTAGTHEIAAAYPKIFEGLPPAIGGPNPSKLPQPPPRNPESFLQPLPKDATPKQIEERKALIARIRERFSKPKFDGMAVGIVEIVGPSDPVKGPFPETSKKLYACGHLTGGHGPGCYRKIISSVAARAYRRPLSPDEIDSLVAIANRPGPSAANFERGLTLALQAILVSPDFLFRIESAPVLTPYQLASRLSYFLWSSMPDERLMRAAAANTLRNPSVLRAQVTRMLKDDKAQAFISNFAGQWLETRRLEGMQPDRDRFPDFDDMLRESMAQETEQFFASIVKEDKSILDLVTADYTFVNERLARHYGIKGVTGPEFRRVSLAGTGRVGVMTHASVLTVSSYNNRTSPVLRGKWILENILNSPPPPPPPNVPALDEAAVGATGSLRQQMEKHRANAVCSSCHSRMDPLGFAVENYNAVGVWRTTDGKFPIDPSGALPDGRTIKGPEDLRGILAADKESFTRALSEKLLIYALGRGVERFDRATVKNIATRAAANDYKFSSLILGIVGSVPFQMQTADRPKS